MLIEKFESFWLDIFGAADDKIVLSVITDDLAKSGFIPAGREIEFQSILVKFLPAGEHLHLGQMHQMIMRLMKEKMLFAAEEVRSMFKLKVKFERDMVAWLIDAADAQPIKDTLKFLVNDMKLSPAHFSDITAQSLYRLISRKMTDGTPWDLPSIPDFGPQAENYGLGPMSLTELVTFLEEHRRNIDGLASAIINSAEKVIQLNEMLMAKLDLETAAYNIVQEHDGAEAARKLNELPRQKEVPNDEVPTGSEEQS